MHLPKYDDQTLAIQLSITSLFWSIELNYRENCIGLLYIYWYGKYNFNNK
jgi:hypothetical protein